jgi:hypothetical protein
MGTTIRAHIFADIMMADLTEVCVWIYLGSTMWTSSLTDRLTTLCTEHGLRVVDGTAIWASLTCSLTLLGLIHRLLGRIRLLLRFL